MLDKYLNWKPGDKIESPVADMVTFDPSAHGIRDVYKLMVGAIVPRPIAFVSTVNKRGEVNLAPFSFFNGVSSHPPCLMISVTYQKDGSKKDTLRNIEETGQFVVNSANEWLAQPLAHCGSDYPYGVDEMKKVGLTPLASQVVAPPRVKESAIQFECRTYKTMQIGEGGPGACMIVVGEILRLHVSAHVYRDGKIDPLALKPIARLGGHSYTNVSAIFDMPTPKPL